jgi:hypothetical protein
MSWSEKYKKIIFDLILEYKIKVIQWKTANEGYALFDSWEIAIPKPISLTKFMTCAHEIGHLIKDKDRNPMWYSEYVATKYSIDVCKQHDISITVKELKNALNYLTVMIAEDIVENDVDFFKIAPHVLNYANIDTKLWAKKYKQGYVPIVKSINPPGWYKISITWTKKKHKQVLK